MASSDWTLWFKRGILLLLMMLLFLVRNSVFAAAPLLMPQFYFLTRFQFGCVLVIFLLLNVASLVYGTPAWGFPSVVAQQILILFYVWALFLLIWYDSRMYEIVGEIGGWGRDGRVATRAFYGVMMMMMNDHDDE